MMINNNKKFIQTISTAKWLCALLLVLLTLETSAQKNRPKGFDEIGLLVGAGYYNGEICPTRPFYKPKFAFGLNLRHGLNERFAITFQAIRCLLEGNDLDFDNAYQQQRKASFENEIVELSLQAEVNFLPLIKGDPYHCISPYIAAGPGLAVGSFPNEGLQFCIPFGVGVKFSPTKRITLSAEWKYRKMFTDVLDHINEDIYDATVGIEHNKQKSFLGDKDWYSIVAAVFNVNIGGGKTGNACPAYR